jgi:hypothetical protein
MYPQAALHPLQHLDMKQSETKTDMRSKPVHGIRRPQRSITTSLCFLPLRRENHLLLANLLVFPILDSYEAPYLNDWV